MLRKEVIKETEERKYRLEQNKIFDGMNSKNTNDIQKNKEQHFYPIQHPKNLTFNDTNIISYKPPVQNLTDYNRISYDAMIMEIPKFDSPIDSKSLDIGILGPPNAGKSSLMNK